MNDIKNIIFDIGGIVTEETGAKAFTHLSKMEIKVLDNIVFYDKRFNEVIKGNLSSKEYTEQLIKENPQYENEIKEMLNPKKQDIYDKINQDVVDLLYKLKEKYHIYFLSNMIDITYDYLERILNDFDGGVYSFIEHTKKPDEKIFLTLINRYNINAKETIYFDDKIRNIEVASKLGIKAIKFEKIEDVINNI